MIIGITGGVGTGKSTVLGILEEDFGANIIMADEVAKYLQAPGGRCYAPIVDAFGEEILDMEDPAHPIDRAKLASIVFEDPDKLEDLNYIVHPLVKIEIMCQISGFYNKNSEALIVIEAALLIEAGYTDIIDELWVVTADREIRIQRLEESRGYTREKCEAVMASQLSEEEFADFADFVVDNSGSIEDTKKQIAERLTELDILED
ncbi:MAG: dephospho-CoA kinase [Lachnospiraceae bacterium]|nr:dephospho-CoA kinase [Lachnospiraceae bacterium]